jgi:hypothetical protein
MDESQFIALKDRAKDSWETAEKYRLAYIEKSSIDSKFASVIKWLTLFSGLITGASTLPQIFDQDISNSLTAIAGMITGILTLADKLFQWEAKSNEYWSGAKSLESIQSELYQFLVGIVGGDEENDIGFRMQRFHEKVKDLTQLKVSGEDKYAQLAMQSLKEHKIAHVKFHVDPPIREVVEDESSLAENAEGVVAPRSAVGLGVGA